MCPLNASLQGFICKHALDEPKELRDFIGSTPAVIPLYLLTCHFPSGKGRNLAFADKQYEAT